MGASIGDNTDVGGFTRAVETLLGAPPRDLTIGVLGARRRGGRRCSRRSKTWPGVGRTSTTARPSARGCSASDFAPSRNRSMTSARSPGRNLSCNATSVGLRDDSFPDGSVDHRARSAAIDLVYRRGETAWVRAVRGGGHRARDGIAMLVEQGALAFERWFGVAPDRAAMWEAIGVAARDVDWSRWLDSVVAVGCWCLRAALRRALSTSAAAQLCRLRAPARSAASAKWSAADAGRGCRCCRRPAVIAVVIRPSGHVCRWCELLPPYVRAARSVCWATGGSRTRRRARAQVPGWHRVGARRWRVRMARARLAGRRLEERRRSFRCRCRRSAQRERGYNQSEQLARELATRWHLPVLDRRARAHASHRDADAVDTRGPTPQRFGRVPRASCTRRTRFAARISSSWMTW